MKKDYKQMWYELKYYITELSKIEDCSSAENIICSGAMRVAGETILKIIDRIENGFAKCEDCVKNIEAKGIMYCKKCLGKRLEENRKQWEYKGSKL